MSDQNREEIVQADSDTIEDKRRKNLIDNQKFLESLKLINVRDDLKSTVNSVATADKPPRKKYQRKEKIDPSEIRRSSRIRSMPQTQYDNQSTLNDEDFIVSTDDSSNDEEEEDELISAFTAKVDDDWKPAHSQKLPTRKEPRPIRKAAKIASGHIKIYEPNVGLKASTVTSKDNSQKSYVTKKINVAISSSSEED